MILVGCGISTNHANNNFLMVGDYGSIDNLSNSKVTNIIYPKVELNSITLNDKIKVAVGNNGTIITSKNGIDWVAMNSGIESNLSGITVSNQGVFVAVGNNGTIITSKNGIDWVAVNSGTTNALMGVTVNNQGMFIAVGDNGTILTSNNSIDWELLKMFNGVTLLSAVAI